MNKIIQRTEEHRKTGDFIRSASINGRVERIKAAKVEKKRDLSVWRKGWWLFTERDGGRQREEEREASPAEWC